MKFLSKGGGGRFDNSYRNYVFGTAGKLIELVIRFISRTIFIQTLGTTYLGINGVFSNILSFLSLAELGIGTAITFSLYEPIARGDYNKIAILIRIYKKAYYVIGIFIMIGGMLLTPFLHFFISSDIGIDNLSLIYFLYIFNSSISYFYSYKAVAITAHQKNYIVSNNQYIWAIICSIVQCLVLLATGNYLLYLFIGIFFTIVTNLCISKIANDMYPILKENIQGQIDKETKTNIVKNVKAIFVHKIGGLVVNSTDNLLLSFYFGVTIVGLYSNYLMLITAVESFTTLFFTSIMASVGNLKETAEEEKQIQVYDAISFLQFWIFSFSSCAFVLLMRPFITLWLGENYLMTELCEAVIIINFYLKGLRQTNGTFNVAYGLSKHYTFMPIPESLINLFSSIILAKIIGPAGIFVGTTISTILAPFWIEPYILFKHGFKAPIKGYALKTIKYIFLTVLMVGVIEIAGFYINGDGLLQFVVRMGIVLLIPNIMVVILFKKSNEFNYIKNLFIKKIRK